MTTKRKIVLSLFAMMLVVIMLAVVGLRTATEANRSLAEYAELAELNFLLSDSETEVYRLAYNMSQFMIEVDSDYVDLALKGIEALEGNGKRIAALLEEPELIELVSGSVDGLEDYKRIVVNLEMKAQDTRKEYRGEFNRALTELNHYLNELSDFLSASGRMESYRVANRAGEYLSLAAVNIGLFSINLRDESLLTAEASFIKAAEALQELGALDPDVIDSYKQNVRTSFEDARRSFEAIKTYGMDAKLSVLEAAELSREIMSIIARLNNDTNESTSQVIRDASADSAQTRMLVIVISIFGLVLCLGLSVGIILKLTKTLKGMARYAENIAQGNFDYKNSISERGEIGQVVDALAQIPVVLQEQVAKAVSLANQINSGCLRERLAVDGYEGGFGQIARVINSVSDSYTTLLDNLPLVIFTGDKNCTIQYLNAEAERVFGPMTGHNCAEAISADVCVKKGSCSGKNCMTTGERQKGFASTQPRGNKLEMEYASSPLRDLDGNIAGFIEILNDLTQIKGQQQTMLRVARQAEEISGRVATASEQLAAQVEQISQGTELQKQRMDSTASAMSQMNSSVMEVARSASQASEHSEKARKQASTGSELVGNVVHSVNNVNSVSTHLQKNMEELGRQVENIGGVMDVISDIADQTNLLALNAAIEAARAGDAGRGFAVVADEVRKLAEKTMLATQEVGNTISAIQEATRVNISGISTAVTSVSEATELADKSGQALREIVELAATTSQLIASIATAAEEQSVTSDEISQAVEDINRVTAETATGMFQSSSAVQELSDMAQQLRDIIGELQ